MVVKGFVLAGGQAARFGSNKALHSVRGVPMVLWVVRALEGAGLDVQVVVREPLLAELDLNLLQEPEMEGFHPLHGVQAALKSLGPDEYALLAPCDVPALQSEAVEALLAVGGPAVAFDGERLHPLVSLVPAAWLQTVEALLRRGGAVQDLFSGVSRVLIEPDQLRNVNRVEDL